MVMNVQIKQICGHTGHPLNVYGETEWPNVGHVLQVCTSTGILNHPAAKISPHDPVKIAELVRSFAMCALNSPSSHRKHRSWSIFDDCLYKSIGGQGHARFKKDAQIANSACCRIPVEISNRLRTSLKTYIYGFCSRHSSK